MAPMRALAYLIPLLLSLVLAQAGGHAHRIAHLGEHLPSAAVEPAGAIVEHEEEHPHAAFCADCLALHGLDLPLAHLAPPALGSAPRLEPLSPTGVARITPPRTRPRCRAPPVHA